MSLSLREMGVTGSKRLLEEEDMVLDLMGGGFWIKNTPKVVGSS